MFIHRGSPQTNGWRPILIWHLGLCFGVLECGMGWSKRYKGVRILWKKKEVYSFKFGKPVDGYLAYKA
jgi:hypothetical protein